MKFGTELPDRLHWLLATLDCFRDPRDRNVASFQKLLDISDEPMADHYLWSLLNTATEMNYIVSHQDGDRGLTCWTITELGVQAVHDSAKMFWARRPDRALF
jgi:hypothetical protein